MNQTEVLTLLGKPSDTGDLFYIGQEQGFEDAYQRAAVSQAVHYFFWKRGIDVVYVVGVDPQGEVVLLESGVPDVFVSCSH